jgi:hypothetical protein
MKRFKMERQGVTQVFFMDMWQNLSVVGGEHYRCSSKWSESCVGEWVIMITVTAPNDCTS